ncbi:MAG: DMT family transporter [Bacteroidota bacterium]
MKRAYFKMHAAIFLWGFTGLLGKLIQLNEGVLVWYRMLISAVAVAIILLYKKKIPKLTFRELAHISGIGILVMMHWVAFYASIKLASISIAMVCLSSIALFVSFIEPLLYKEKFDYMEIFFSALAVIGISTIYRSDPTASAGIIVGILSALFSAIFSSLNKGIASKHEPLTISLVELSSGFIFLTLLFPLYMKIQPTDKFLPGTMDWIYLMILSLFCTVLTWILSLEALQKVSAYTVALALNLEPLYGIILAVVFAGEGKILNAGFYYGAGIILLTIVLHTIYKFRKKIRSRILS